MIATTSRHRVDDLNFDGDDMLITIDGQGLRFALDSVSPRLLHASPSARRHFEISASGYGIHWPEVDEDLSVEGLLKATDSDR